MIGLYTPLRSSASGKFVISNHSFRIVLSLQVTKAGLSVLLISLFIALFLFVIITEQ